MLTISPTPSLRSSLSKRIVFKTQRSQTSNSKSVRHPSFKTYAAEASAAEDMFYDEPEKKPLVVVGSINADLVIEVDRLPKPGETLSGNSLNVYPGGKGANQAAAAAKLGYPTFFVGQVGKDAYAALLRNALNDCNVDTSMIYTVDGSCGTALVLLQPNGENSIILIGGANTSEEWEITDEVTAAIQSAGAVLLQREIPDVVNTIFAKLATSARVPVILDAGGMDRKLGHDLLSNVSVLSPNETELERLTNLPTKSEKQCEAAAEALVHQGVDKVIVKMGSKGSMLVDIYGNIIKQKALPVMHVIDTTGAGDCFTGAYAVAMLEGKKDVDAMKFASAAASLCIQKSGAIPSLPTREEVEKEIAHRHNASKGGGGGGGNSDDSIFGGSSGGGISGGSKIGGGSGGGGFGSPREAHSPGKDHHTAKQSFW